MVFRGAASDALQMVNNVERRDYMAADHVRRGWAVTIDPEGHVREVK
jgi:hypothetical protein